MARVLWFIARRFYIFGLFFVLPLFLIVVVTGISEDPEVAIPVAVFCASYVAAGIVLFWFLPRRWHDAIQDRFAALSPSEFVASARATSLLYERGVAFDLAGRKLLYVDTSSGVQECMDFDSVRTWELTSGGNMPDRLIIATDSASAPEIKLDLPAGQGQEFGGLLRAVR